MILAVSDGVSLSFDSSSGVSVASFPRIFSWPFAFSSVSAPPFQCHHQEGNRIVALQRRCMIVCAPRLGQFGCPLVTEVTLFLQGPDQV